MSNLPKPRPPLTVTVKKAFRITRANIFLIVRIINSICIAVIFIHLGSTIPALKPYVNYAGHYGLGGRTAYSVGLFLVGCSWWFRRWRVVAPKQAESRSSTISGKKIGRWQRIHFATIGACNTTTGFVFVSGTWRGVYLSVYIYAFSLLILCSGVCFIYMAYVGRESMKDENQTVGNNDGQPESIGVTAGEHNRDKALGGVVMVQEAVERAA